MDLEAEKKPALVQKLDDRVTFIFRGAVIFSRAVLAYTVRAAYTGEMTIPMRMLTHVCAGNFWTQLCR